MIFSLLNAVTKLFCELSVYLQASFFYQPPIGNQTVERRTYIRAVYLNLSLVPSSVPMSVRPFLCLPVCSFLPYLCRSLVRPFYCPSFSLSVRPSVRPSVRSLTRSFVRSFVHSFVRSFVRSFMSSYLSHKGYVKLVYNKYLAMV